MPYREFTRNQVYLLPPALDDFVPADHPARFVAAFVDGLDLDALGIRPAAEVEGRPSYPPRLLLCCWVYGFLTQVDTCRRLERACRENVAFMWLTGMARPDHNTLWRLYHAHEDAMHTLFHQSVKLAVGVGMVDFALQAVDGTKVAAAASAERTLNRQGLAALAERAEAKIAALEAANEAEATSGEGSSWRLPKALADQQRLREQIAAARKALAEAPERTTVNLTDPDAGTVLGRHGYLTGYNAQAVADTKVGILVGLGVATNAADQIQLVPMLDELQVTAERLPDELVADAGYYSGANVAEAEQRGLTFFAPVPPGGHAQDPTWPYHVSHFRFDAATDTYTCPEHRRLVFAHEQKRGRKARVYRGEACDDCPVRAACTRSPRGRSITRYPWEAPVAGHKERMRTAAAAAALHRRRELIEPVFGFIKEQMGFRRFRRRGLEGVRAEWSLLGTAYNLRKLYRYWWRPQACAAALSAA